MSDLFQIVAAAAPSPYNDYVGYGDSTQSPVEMGTITGSPLSNSGYTVNAFFSDETSSLSLALTGASAPPPANVFETLSFANGELNFSDVTDYTVTGNLALFKWAAYPPPIDFQLTAGDSYTVSLFSASTPGKIVGQGDITNPSSWQDADGNIPPSQFSNVPQNLNYPLDGDGRYWWQLNANIAGPGAITFIGDANLLTAGQAEVALTWQITQFSEDGSTPVLQYSTDGGATYQSVFLSQALQSGIVVIDMTDAVGLIVGVISDGGTASSSAALFEVAVAITRNAGQGPVYNYPDPLTPTNYNPDAYDFPGYQTLSELRTRIMLRLGFAAQVSDPPTGMTDLLNEFLTSSQNLLYWRYPALQTRRLFRWKLVPGQRFYSLLDNDEAASSNFMLNPNKTIEWAGMEDNRNVWYPLIEGIPPELYTMIQIPWRPARFEIRSALEVYPAPNQTYWMWIKGHMGMLPFSSDDDATTIDSELVYLWALQFAKYHYGQPDAPKIEQAANIMLAVLTAATHGRKRYIPGAVPVPPAVRPTLISYNDGSGGQ